MESSNTATGKKTTGPTKEKEVSDQVNSQCGKSSVTARNR